MKIDRRRPGHWLLLAMFFLQSSVGLVLRLVLRRGDATVVLYGHKLNGNLLALHRYMDAHPEVGFRPVFLTMDRDYHEELCAKGIGSVLASGAGCACLLASSSALISDHGLHAMQPLRAAYRYLGLRFFDVWHGIPFKGFDAEDFFVQHRYDETWVASELNRELYVDRFGFEPKRVVATGYARTDRLVRANEETLPEIRASLGLPVAGKLILFAPTWSQDSAGRNLFPFGCDAQGFLGKVSEIAARHDAGIVLRTHLNSYDVETGAYANVHSLPVSSYPDAETVLMACDAIVCDWSSIAFDFLLLDRPAIFLDVEPPFRKGFSLGPEYRYGVVVNDLEAMTTALGQILAQPDTYWQVNAARHHGIKQAVYGGLADGKASERCVQRLAHLFAESQGGGQPGS